MKLILEEFRQERRTLCGDLPEQVRRTGPLVHLLTNYVTVTDCVNGVLAIGGRAICSHAPQEASQVTSGADALVCNLGATEYYDAMDLSAAQALSATIPLVIDPVGCAASAFRLDMCMHLTNDFHPAAIRGNYAELAVVTGCTGDAAGYAGSRGLDGGSALSSGEHDQLKEHMMAFASRYDTILIASGGVDLITDGVQMIENPRGTAKMRQITGTGCMSGGILAAFLSCDPSLDAAACAVRFISLAGEAAQACCEKTGTGAGHFHMFLMDALSQE